MKRSLTILIAVFAVILGGAASAVASPAPATAGPPSVIKVNLHHAYVQHANAKAGKLSGIVRPRNHPRPAHGLNIKAACTEPNCNLVWHGGPVEHTPKVYLLFWGPNWSSTGSDANYLVNFMAGLGIQPLDDWSDLTSQYPDGSGHPTFSASTLQSPILQDSSTPPAGVTQNQLAAEADAGATSSPWNISDFNNSQIVIATQSGTFPAGFNTQYCAYHTNSSGTGVAYTNLPYMPDAGTNCGAGIVTGNAFDGFSIVEGHEYAETVTDPFPNSGWIDLADNVSGGENGDKCAWTNLFAKSMTYGTFALQPLWSNAAGGCRITADSVSMTNPGSQSANLGGAVSLQIHASSSLGEALRYSATGLPSGLGINASTGLISGHVTFPGNFTAHVTARDTGEASASAAFAWRVYPVHGAVKAWFHNTHCVNDGSLINGTMVVMWSCNGSLAQQWAGFPGGTLRRYNGANNINTRKCMDIRGASTANGTKIDLYTCTGGWNQVWSYSATTHQWRNPHSGKCLNDPGTNLANGTQLVLWSCTGDPRNEQWSNI